MRACITQPRKAAARIDFDRVIPSFPSWAIRPNRVQRRDRRESLFTRVDVSNDRAKDLAFENAGRLPVELSRPAIDVYHDFLTELILIDGFVGVYESHRYDLTIQAGRLFEAREVAHNTIAVIHATFYPAEKLDILDMEHRSPNGCKLSLPPESAKGSCSEEQDE